MLRLSTKVHKAFHLFIVLLTSFTAIDRVHRIGQEKTVYVTHFIVRILLSCRILLAELHHWQVDRTIENRVLRIQKRKTAIINEAFKGSGKADPDSIQNLKIMFGDDEE